MKFGLIGDPISHSQSPELFRRAYNGKYCYDLIEGKYFEESYSKFLKGYEAINVTAPFKEAAYEKADVVSGPAALIGAANILVKGEDGVSCHNSDFTGIILCVAEALFPGITVEFYGEFGERAHIKIHQFTRDRIKTLEERPKALIVSCGGAGKAAAVAAAELGYEVWILNRSIEKAEKFVKGLPEYGFRTGGLDDFKERLRNSDLVIYTAPAALDCIPELERDDFKPGQIFLEANYKNPSFKGLTMARMMDARVRYIPGRMWLVNQAISGYALMTGEAPDVKSLLF